MNIKKIAYAALGFVAGVVSIPLMVIGWPIMTAWFMWNEYYEDFGND